MKFSLNVKFICLQQNLSRIHVNTIESFEMGADVFRGW